MDFLQSVIEKRKQDISALGGSQSGKRWICRKELTSAETVAAKAVQEETAKKRKFVETQRLQQLQTYITKKGRRPENSAEETSFISESLPDLATSQFQGFDSGGNVKVNSSSRESNSGSLESFETVIPISKEEVIRRLRRRCNVVTYFGETDLHRYQRLCRLEIQEHEDDLHGGQQNVFLQFLEGSRNRGRGRHPTGSSEHALFDEDFDEDIVEAPTSSPPATRASDSSLSCNSKTSNSSCHPVSSRSFSIPAASLPGPAAGRDSTATSGSQSHCWIAGTAAAAASADSQTAAVVETSLINEEGEEGTRERAMVVDPTSQQSTLPSSELVSNNSNASQAVTAPPADVFMEDRVRSWIRRMLSEWEAELQQRGDELKATKVGQIMIAQCRQTRKDVRPLMKRLKAREVDEAILTKLYWIVVHCEMKEYKAAHDKYIELSIGNAAWPMGVTMVGIHERAGRSKIFTSEIAHILNDETTRKYIHMVKRLLSFAQRKYPTDPSKMISISYIPEASI